LEVVEACSDDLIRLIIVYEVFPILKERLQYLSITFSVYALWVSETGSLLLNLEIKEIFNWEESVKTIIMLQ